MRRFSRMLALLAVAGFRAAGQSEDPSTGRNSWEACFNRPAEWYGTATAVRIADNVLLNQRSTGGWPKNIDLVRQYTPAEKDSILLLREHAGSTIDNGATYSELRYLHDVYRQTRMARFADAFHRGLRYLLDAQYPNGGWPQFLPTGADYSSHITFNDDAMTGVLNLFYDLIHCEGDSSLVDAATNGRLEKSLDRGIRCILDCQVRKNGERTAWCAQHDEKTLAPAAARAYELPSLSGKESVGIVLLLMRLDHPSPEIVDAVQGAVKWFDRSRVEGVRVTHVPDSTSPNGLNKVVVRDSSAPSLWGRFYDLETNEVFYCSRDGVKRKSMADISSERRNHYGWLDEWPKDLLAIDYPAWQKKWAPGANVLRKGNPSQNEQ